MSRCGCTACRTGACWCAECRPGPGLNFEAVHRELAAEAKRADRERRRILKQVQLTRD